jgi:Xaa-Pro aminopeptidase
MEREEAAASGCQLLHPGELDLQPLRRQTGQGHLFWAAVVEATLARAAVHPGAVSLAGRIPGGLIHATCGHLEAKGWKFGDGSHPVRLLRKYKNPVEIDEVKRSAGIIETAFHKVAELLVESVVRADELWLQGERLRVGRLRSEVTALLAAGGLEQPTGNIFSVGAKAGIPHSQGDSTDQLKVGETLVTDIFPRDTLFADCTRTFCVGAAGEQVRAAHQEVYRALREAQRTARPGIKANDLQQSVCDRFEKSGYITPRSSDDPQHGYVHNLGHGVGYELHEYPTFSDTEANEGRLEVGDLFTLEPGLYEPAQKFGIRLEDLCYLRSDGLELLTDLPYDLDPRAWVKA